MKGYLDWRIPATLAFLPDVREAQALPWLRHVGSIKKSRLHPLAKGTEGHWMRGDHESKRLPRGERKLRFSVPATRIQVPYLFQKMEGMYQRSQAKSQGSGFIGVT